MKSTVASTINRLDNEIHDNLVNEHPQKETPLDTCFKWTPLAFLLACSAGGLKTRNSYEQQILMVLAGNMVLNVAIQPVKHLMNRARPNGGSKSFPSAHTATGFLTSEIVYQELKENYRALRHTGYAVSIVTGWLRLYHNKHWFSDVVGGALIGILVGRVSSSVFNNSRKDLKRQA